MPVSQNLTFLLAIFSKPTFSCSDPPLEESDIPNGKWLCNNCRHTKTGESSRAVRTQSTTSARSGEGLSRPVTPANSDVAVKEGEITHQKVKQLRQSRSRKSSASSETSDKNGKPVEVPSEKLKEEIPEVKEVEKTEKEEESKENEPEVKISTPMDELLKAAIIMNPRVFELPREMEIFSQFPGEDKSSFLPIFLLEHFFNTKSFF